jgi:hypothetical protein
MFLNKQQLKQDITDIVIGEMTSASYEYPALRMLPMSAKEVEVVMLLIAGGIAQELLKQYHLIEKEA